MDTAPLPAGYGDAIALARLGPERFLFSNGLLGTGSGPIAPTPRSVKDDLHAVSEPDGSGVVHACGIADPNYDYFAPAPYGRLVCVSVGPSGPAKRRVLDRDKSYERVLSVEPTQGGIRLLTRTRGNRLHVLDENREAVVKLSPEEVVIRDSGVFVMDKAAFLGKRGIDPRTVRDEWFIVDVGQGSILRSQPLRGRVKSVLHSAILRDGDDQVLLVGDARQVGIHPVSTHGLLKSEVGALPGDALLGGRPLALHGGRIFFDAGIDYSPQVGDRQGGNVRYLGVYEIGSGLQRISMASDAERIPTIMGIFSYYGRSAFSQLGPVISKPQ